MTLYTYSEHAVPESPKPVEKPVPDWDLSTHTLLEVCT